MGSSPGDTTIKSCGKLHSVHQTRTVTVFPCRTFQTKNNKPSEGYQDRFPQYLDCTHIGTNKEASRKVYKNNNGTPTHEKTSTEANQKEISRYRPRIKVKYQCIFLHYCGPKKNRGGLLRLMYNLPNHIQQRK